MKRGPFSLRNATATPTGEQDRKTPHVSLSGVIVIAPIAASAALFDAVQNRFHLRDRKQLELPFQSFGNPAPQIHADAGKRTVRIDVSVGGHVINCDAKRRSLARLGFFNAHGIDATRQAPRRRRAKNALASNTSRAIITGP